MTPCPTATAPQTMDTQSPRLNKRRNAMANVMDGMSDEDISLIRSQHCLNTAQPTCISATASSSTTRERSTSSTSSCSETESVIGSGLVALSLESSSPLGSPHQSPSLRRRRNGVPHIFADVDSETVSRLRLLACMGQSTSQHERADNGMLTL